MTVYRGPCTSSDLHLLLARNGSGRPAPRRRAQSSDVAPREHCTSDARRFADPNRFVAHCTSVALGKPVETTGPDIFDADPVSMATGGNHGFLFEDADGFVATSGVATRLTLPAGLHSAAAAQVASWLAAVPTTGQVGHPGTGPIVVGALPFVPGQPSELIVPSAVLVGDSAGRRWLTRIRPSTATDPSDAQHLGHRLTPGAVSPELLSLREEPDGATFEQQVTEALAAVAAGDIAKVVLARRARATFSTALDVASLLDVLRHREGAATVFAQLDGETAFVGASPELLVRRRGDQVRSHPLAGTRALGDPVDGDLEVIVAHLLGAPKDLAEHQAAADSVAAGLAPWCDRLDVPSRPDALILRDMVHLGTLITGQLRVLPQQLPDGTHQLSPADALTLVAALHPTPAVAGVPTAEALALIARLEGDQRGLYAGPVGWMDSRGDGTYVVGIRSATITGCQAVVHAGAGIVAGSVPADELAETTTKLGTMLGALGVPTSGPGGGSRRTE